MIPSRRSILLTVPALLIPPAARAAPTREITVYKTPWCGCCAGWVKHLDAAGFATRVVELEDLTPVRAKYGVPPALSSCHTGVSGGYVFEGHVPIADVERLLAERPKARGLAVPGMPVGSPGMEAPGRPADAFETLLMLTDGSARIYTRHPAG